MTTRQKIDLLHELRMWGVLGLGAITLIEANPELKIGVKNLYSRVMILLKGE